MDSATYRQLLGRARRLVPTRQDADDLVQDSLLAALQAGRSDLPWLFGVLRKQAAMQARGAVRRRLRDLRASGPVAMADTPKDIAHDHLRALMASLPPGARRVAVLALHGLTADEIRWLLGLSATAFRQRLTSIRRGLQASPLSRSERIALAHQRDPARSIELQFGLARRALKAALNVSAGLGTHDHDGHLLVLRDPRPNANAHVSGTGGNR